MWFGLIVFLVLHGVVEVDQPVSTGVSDMSELETITKAVEKLDPDFARKMRSDPTRIQRYPTDFFRKGRIYHISANGRSGPRQMTLGLIENEFAVSLGSNPDGFFELAKRAGAQLDTPQRRDAYVKTFLEVT